MSCLSMPSIIECGKSATTSVVPFPAGPPLLRNSLETLPSPPAPSGFPESLCIPNGGTMPVIAWTYSIGLPMVQSLRQQVWSIPPSSISTRRGSSSWFPFVKSGVWLYPWQTKRYVGASTRKLLKNTIFGAGSNTTNIKLILPSYMQAQFCGMSADTRQMRFTNPWPSSWRYSHCGHTDGVMVRSSNKSTLRRDLNLTLQSFTPSQHFSILIDHVMTS